MARGGNQPLDKFVHHLSLPEEFVRRAAPETAPVYENAIEWLSRHRPSRQNFWPALCLALISQAEEVLAALGESSILDVWRSVPQTAVAEGQVRNTLSFTVGARQFSLRSRYNEAQNVIRVELRREHPSAPGHATQAWPQYRDLITHIYRAAPAERLMLAQWIWKDVLALPETIKAGARERRIRPFHRVIQSLDTTADRGGAIWQAIVYGYLSADSPSLILESHAVNVGSSRAGMIGDIDGFLGGSPVLAAEAKDYAITLENAHELHDFLEDVAQYPDVDAAVFAGSFTDDVQADLEAVGVRAVSKKNLLATVALWDIPKQEDAIRAMRYYLSRIQKRNAYLERLDRFLKQESVHL